MSQFKELNEFMKDFVEDESIFLQSSILPSLTEGDSESDLERQQRIFVNVVRHVRMFKNQYPVWFWINQVSALISNDVTSKRTY